MKNLAFIFCCVFSLIGLAAIFLSVKTGKFQYTWIIGGLLGSVISCAIYHRGRI